MSFLIVEQSIKVALRYAQQAYVLESGRVVSEGPGTGAAREYSRFIYGWAGAVA
ncbi:MAG: hypothetical protein ABI606_00845 [Rhodoferax sp.]